MVEAIFYALCIIVTGYVVHELAHFALLQFYTKEDVQITFKREGKYYVFRVGTDDQYAKLKPYQAFIVYIAGFGSVVLLTIWAMTYSWIYFICIVPAFLSSTNDFALAKENFRKIWRT